MWKCYNRATSLARRRRVERRAFDAEKGQLFGTLRRVELEFGTRTLRSPVWEHHRKVFASTGSPLDLTRLCLRPSETALQMASPKTTSPATSLTRQSGEPTAGVPKRNTFLSAGERMSCEREFRDAQLDGPTHHENSFPVRPGRQRLKGGPDKVREKACALRIRGGDEEGGRMWKVRGIVCAASEKAFASGRLALGKRQQRRIARAPVLLLQGAPPLAPTLQRKLSNVY